MSRRISQRIWTSSGCLRVLGADTSASMPSCIVIGWDLFSSGKPRGCLSGAHSISMMSSGRHGKYHRFPELENPGFVVFLGNRHSVPSNHHLANRGTDGSISRLVSPTAPEPAPQTHAEFRECPMNGRMIALFCDLRIEKQATWWLNGRPFDHFQGGCGSSGAVSHSIRQKTSAGIRPPIC